MASQLQTAQDHPQPVIEPAEAPRGPQATQRRVLCGYHCDCGRHFASLTAFDLHRPGKTGHRKCVDPATVFTDGKRRLVPKGTDAICRLTRFDKVTGESIDVVGVTVWQTVEAAGA